MTGVTIQFGELQPWLSSILRACVQKFQCRPRRLELAQSPGSRLKICLSPFLRVFVAGVGPVPCPTRMESGKLELQARMAGGNHVMVHVGIRGADVAVQAELRSPRDTSRFPHAKTSFLFGR